ncbi:MAG: N-acetylneuraminate synthase family protein [Candidatus Omnitrophota bacterium]|nr:MAG: N-acetylneuraminate synthase family protein [Candidatus Omnitrophota bacterium]
MRDKVSINNRHIGKGHPCYIILEAGVNFDDIIEAKKLIDSGVRLGADCIKFQTFHAQTTVIEGTSLKDGRGIIDQHKEFTESQEKQTEDFQKKLFAYAKSKDITAFSTPSHFNDVDLLERIADPPAYKLGSDDLTNIPLLKYIARLKKPMIISSGVSYLSEIDTAIRAIREEGNDNIVLLHCISQYPARPEDMNLRAMQTLINTFDLPVGLSDHTMTSSISLAAVALGACVIERHFTLNRESPGPDNFFSMLPEEMALIIKGIREIETALGSPYKKIAGAEKDMRPVFKKSIYAIRNIREGEMITEKNVDILRPAGGIEPRLLQHIYGMRVRRDMSAGEPLTWECFK